LRTKRVEPDGTVYEYFYNGDQLTWMTIDNGTTTSVEYTLFFTYDATGTPLSVTCAGVTYYYVTNLQGDVVGIIDNRGHAVAYYAYDAWGNILDEYIGGFMCVNPGDYVLRYGYGDDSAPDAVGRLNPLRYRGYVYDKETGLYYLQSRYYNPEWGRFITADSVSYLGIDDTPTSYNPFAYCGNNPVMYSDPTGHAVETIFDILSLAASIADVTANPLNPWAWAGLVGDVIDVAVPFLTGVGEITKAAGSYVRVITNMEDVIDAAKTFRRTAEAVDDIKDSVGTYVVLYKSMSNYVGKGPFSRAIKSATNHLKKSDEVLAIIWVPASNDKAAFIAEYLLQSYRKVGLEGTNTFNKIWSPGKNLLG